MVEEIKLSAVVRYDQSEKRLDQVLAELFPDYSRSRIKEWIVANKVQLNGCVISKPKMKVLGGEQITVNAAIEQKKYYEPQNLPLNIVYEDDDILVINKPYNFVVHPGAGNPIGTVLNALLYHYPDSALIPRCGIVHRLDKDTSGLMIIAKTVVAQIRLVESLKRHEIVREYEGIVTGVMTTGGKIDKPLARHPIKRIQMSVFPLGKPAVTHYRVVERFRAHTRLRLRLETGRTHQIRVHMASIHHSLVGDPLYGGRLKLPRRASEKLITVLRCFNRQALHAVKIEIVHPISKQVMEWRANIPDDMEQLIKTLREDKKMAGGMDK